MKLNTVTVYNLRMCIKKDNPGQKCFKGHSSREEIRSAGSIHCDLIYSSSYYLQMREKQWITISPEAKDLVSRMLEVDAEQRITIEEALQHPWVRVRTLVIARPIKYVRCC